MTRPTIVIVSFDDPNGGGIPDVDLCLLSCELYAEKFEVLHHDSRAQQPYGMMMKHALEKVATDEVILLQDDAVLCPETVEILMTDVDYLTSKVGKVGFVGARSNFVKGKQNIRHPNGGSRMGGAVYYSSERQLVESDFIAPICTWVKRSVIAEVGGFPECHWFSDDVLCWEMKQRGYRHFVSRSYVHHVGMRASVAAGLSPEQMLAEGREWVIENRPAYAAAAGLVK